MSLGAAGARSAEGTGKRRLPAAPSNDLLGRKLRAPRNNFFEVRSKCRAEYQGKQPQKGRRKSSWSLALRNA